MRSRFNQPQQSLHRPHYLNSFFVALLLMLCCLLNVQAAPGDLDGSFGMAGKIVTTFSGRENLNALLLQPDGKVIGVGHSIIGSQFDLALARYNQDGTLDSSFGTGGKVLTPFGSNSVVANAATLQPDGKIIAVGFIGGSGGTQSNDFALARYNMDGMLDSSFGTGGKVITHFSNNNDIIYAVALQTDGKIVVVGETSNGMISAFAVARYNNDGTLDATFGMGGKITSSISNGGAAYSVSIQPDGKIIAAGYALSPGLDFGLVRYNSDGTLDYSFGEGGKVTTPIGMGSSSDFLFAIALQPDGKIVAAGDANGSFALARYNSNGTLDSSFGTGGKVTTSFGVASCRANAVVILSSGKIVAAGETDANNRNFALARYNPDGTLDSSFGTGGEITTQVGSSPCTVHSILLQPDGKIIAGGVANNNFALARYLGDAPIDTAVPGSVIISELRLSGTAGANDEFIELYNNTDAGIAVSSADGSNGWSLVAADGTVRYTIPFNTLIPARGHYLVANNSLSGYSLGNHPAGNLTTAVPDGTYTTEIADNTGVVLYHTANPSNFTPANALDAVGFGATPAPYSEGLPLIPLGTRPSGEDSASNRRRPLKGASFNTTTSGEYSFVRKVPNTNSIPQDTNNNAADFVLVATDAGTYGTQTAQLGAPAPENRSSPVVNNKIAVSLVDPLTSRTAAPNFVRNGSGNSGTLAIRRHFTNSTGATVTRLRFRVYDITTLNTPVLTPPQADLRLTDSTDESVSTTLGMVTVKGTQLEQPPVQSLGGGLNTSVTVSLPAGGLANGAAIDVQFLLNVVQNGRFRFFFTVEAPQ